MATKRFSLLSVILLATFILSACVSGTPVAQGPNEPNLAYTQAVQTVSAIATQNAQSTAYVPQPTATAYPTATLAPSATPLPTQTPLPTATSVPPTPTAVPLPCNVAKFIEDVSAADGTVFGYDNRFTKTWRLQNAGSCRWTTDYSLVYRSGDQMDGASKVSLGESVMPGETIDISINLVAPAVEGSYTGYWALKSDSGQIFGIGASGDQAVWVSIKVVDNAQLFVNYTDDICSRTFTSNTGNLPCPSSQDDFKNGFARLVQNPVLEGGYKDDQPAIVMVPAEGDNGYIQVKFNDFHVFDGEHFRSVIGCMNNSKNCNVKFKLEYSERGGQPQSLGTWTETYDSKLTKINVDLSFLEGKHVGLILTVLSNGSNTEDLAFWLLPGIYR